MKRWPLQKAYFWESAPFFRLLLPFAAGIAWYDHSWRHPGPSVWPFIAASLFFAIFLVAAGARSTKSLFSFISFLSFVSLFCCLGYGIALTRDARNAPRWMGNNLRAGNGNYLVRITGEPQEKDKTWKVPVSALYTINNGVAAPVAGKAFLYIYKNRFPVALHTGDTLTVPAAWQLVQNAGNPFAFDYAGYCRRNNIYYQLFCSMAAVSIYAHANPSQTPFISRAHYWCMQQLDTYLPGKQTKGLMQAMLLGDEVNLDPELRQSYAETGIVHIIAISGGNVAVFFLAISAALRWLRHRRHLWIKYVVALPLVWLYVVMAGAQPSAIRAAVMFSFLAAGIMLQKSNNSLNQLFATAFLLLCVQPMWLYSVGFQLSFLAVLSLVLFYGPVQAWCAPQNKILKGLWNTLAASLAAEILVAPLVIFYFHIFPLLFLVSNAAAFLFMTVVLYAGMAIVTLAWLPPVASAIGFLTDKLVTLFDTIVGWLQNANPASFHFLVLTAPELLLTYLSVASLCVYLLRQHKAALFTGLLAACTLMASFVADEWMCLHQRRLVVYNAGKAAYIELISGHHYTIIHEDTSQSPKDAYVAKPAHTGWRAWRQTFITSQPDICNINGKSVLLLDREPDTSWRFHTDYLVLVRQLKTHPAALFHIFTPSVVILGGTYAYDAPLDCTRFFSGCGIRCHAVAAQGACIIE